MHEIDDKLQALIPSLGGRISESELKLIKGFHHAGEYKLALESILFDVKDEGISLTETERDLIADLVKLVGLDPEWWKKDEKKP